LQTGTFNYYDLSLCTSWLWQLNKKLPKRNNLRQSGGLHSLHS
jgi:hypothetical protein